MVGAYGQDRYGHAWQSQMIPSLAAYPKLASYARDSEEFQTWWVALVRARNRAVDALNLASEIASNALGEVGEGGWFNAVQTSPAQDVVRHAAETRGARASGYACGGSLIL